jgi:hypothetical protein
MWLASLFPPPPPHSPAAAQITLSSVKLYLSLSEVDCYCALWNEILLQSLNAFYASKTVCILLKINLPALYVT